MTDLRRLRTNVRPLAAVALVALASSTITASAHAATVRPTHAGPGFETGTRIDGKGGYSFATLRGINGLGPEGAAAGLMAREWPRTDTVIMTSSDSLADAVSAGPLAARRDQPIVLVDTASAGGTLALGVEVLEREDADEHQIAHVTIIGGTRAVSARY